MYSSLNQICVNNRAKYYIQIKAAMISMELKRNDMYECMLKITVSKYAELFCETKSFHYMLTWRIIKN